MTITMPSVVRKTLETTKLEITIQPGNVENVYSLNENICWPKETLTPKKWLESSSVKPWRVTKEHITQGPCCEQRDGNRHAKREKKRKEKPTHEAHIEPPLNEENLTQD
uniref:Uncharacterized protein n=1 Tax=Compsopogon caeruleus TaxID=31354 RepID=A0A7S1TJ63_9RHOD|mmetsp:Transcript_9246/g.18832  ORF Transcript_9246/g.18832 Transcript_9246/m.18832 type:complete len:109 (+) Transcript_9246:323-649(+)